MSISLAGFEDRTRKAVSCFWTSRDAAQSKQKERGGNDQGARSAVTAGKNLDGFRELVRAVVSENGLPEADLLLDKKLITLPGYFRATKQWDMLVVNKGHLVAALELKSQVGRRSGTTSTTAQRRLWATLSTSGRPFERGPSTRPLDHFWAT